MHSAIPPVVNSKALRSTQHDIVEIDMIHARYSNVIVVHVRSSTAHSRKKTGEGQNGSFPYVRLFLFQHRPCLLGLRYDTPAIYDNDAPVA